MNLTFKSETTSWDVDEHPFDFPGPIETIDVIVTGKGHDRIRPLINCYQNEILDGEDMDDDECESEAARMAEWLCDFANGAVITRTDMRQTVISFEVVSDAGRFARAFGKGA